MDVIASDIPSTTTTTTTTLLSPIHAGWSNNTKFVEVRNGIDVAKTTKPPSQDSSRPNQAKQTDPQWPCPKRQRTTRAASPNSNAISYGMNHHPVDEVLQPNYYSLTIRPKQQPPLDEGLRKLNLFDNDEEYYSVLGVESKSKEATVSKANLSSFDCHTAPVRKTWAGNKYDTTYHPPNESFHEINQSRASPLVKGVSVQRSSRESITPPRPKSNLNFSLDDIFDRGYGTARANTNLLQHTSVDFDAIHPGITVRSLSISKLRARKKKRVRKSVASGTFFDVYEDPPNISPHAQKRNIEHLATSEMDLPKENFTVVEPESASQSSF